MKNRLRFLLIALFLPAAAVVAQEPAEVTQLKSDLIGHTMGGREKAWKFQSPGQIQQLEISSKKEDAKGKVYTIKLTLKDERVPGVYNAQAEVTYVQVDGKWKVKAVGLKSMKRIE